MNGRSRHNLLNRTEKSKVARRIAKQRKNVMKATTDFLNQEKKNLKKPLQSDENIDLTLSDIELINKSLGPPPKKKRRINGGGKSKKMKKKYSPPRKKIPVKKKKVTPIPFEKRTKKLMEEDPDFIGSDDEDFQDLLDSFGNEASTDSSSSASSFNIQGPIPSAAEQKDNENSLYDWIKFSQEANRQFNEEAALVRIEAALAKGKEVQKNKSGKGGRRKTRKKRRSRRKRKTRRKKRKRKTRRKK